MTKRPVQDFETVDDLTDRVIKSGGWFLGGIPEIPGGGTHEYHFQSITDMLAFFLTKGMTKGGPDQGHFREELWNRYGIRVTT